MKRKIAFALIAVFACVGAVGVVLGANDRYYTAYIKPNSLNKGGQPQTFDLVFTNNIISGPSHFLRQIIVTVPNGFKINGTVTVQAPATAPLPWTAKVSGQTITVTSGSTSDASVTAGQSVTITVPTITPACTTGAGTSYTWGISASQVVGGGTGNAYLPTPGWPPPTVTINCNSISTNLSLAVSPGSIITTNTAAQVTLTSVLTRKDTAAPILHEPITFTVGGQPVSCIGSPIYTDLNGVATCSYYPQAAPNTPLPSDPYDCLATFSGDSSIVPPFGSSTAGPVKLNVNATGTGLAVTALSVPYSTTPQAVTLSATLTSGNPALPVAGRTVSFTLGSTTVGSSVTDGSGVATLGATVPVLSPGTYDQYIKASFAADGVYAAASGDAPLTVGQISAAIYFDQTSLTQTYTGQPLSPTVVTNPPGLSYSFTGYPQTNANSYTVNATITDPSYSGSTGPQTFTINQALAAIVVVGYNVTYDGSPHSVTSATATGVQSENLSSGLTLTTTHTNAGTYTDSWTFNGAPNYVSTSGTVVDVISKAASSVTVTGGTYVYDGAAHPATAVATTSVGSLTNPTDVTITYSGSCTSAPVTVSDGTSCTATGTYGGDANHSGSSGTATIVITKANQTIKFTKMVVTATAGGTVSFSSGTPAICSVVQVLDGSSNPVVPGQAVVTLLSGTWAQCSVLANQAGSSDYNAAQQETGVLTVTP